MALTFFTNVGTAAQKVTDNSITLGISVNVPAGSVLIARCGSKHNLGTVGPSTHHSISDTKGHVWTRAVEFSAPTQTVSIFYTTLTVDLLAGEDSITFTHNSTSARVLSVERFGTPPGEEVFFSGRGDGEARFDTLIYTIIYGLKPSTEHTFVSTLGIEANHSVVVTQPTGWTALNMPGTSGGAAESNLQLAGAYRNLTAQDTTYDPTLNVARTFDSVIAAFYTAPVGSSAETLTAKHRINSGSTTSFTDSRGRVWDADRNFSGGNTGSTTTNQKATIDDSLYQTERWGTFNYALTVPNGNYRVNLLFSEIFFGAANQRKFHVDIEGTRVLTNFDVFAVHNANHTAVGKTFDTTVNDGVLNINFVLGAADNPKISAIEVLEVTTAGGPTPISAADTLNTTLTEATSTLAQLIASDTNSLSLTESPSILSTFSASETLNLSLTESPSLLVFLPTSTDTLNLSLTETPTLLVFLPTSTDTLNLSLAETASITILNLLSVSSADTLNLALTESPTLLINIPVSDTLAVTVSDVVSQLAAFLSTADTLNVSVSDVSSVLVPQSSADTLNLTVADIVSSLLAQLSASETLNLTVTDTLSSLLAQLTASDISSISLAESASVFSGDIVPAPPIHISLESQGKQIRVPGGPKTILASNPISTIRVRKS